MVNNEGMLLGIARRDRSRGPMQELDHAAVTVDGGVADDFRGRRRPGGPGLRQVTVLTLAGWRAALDALGRDLPWTARRANLLVDGPSLEDRTGELIRVGGAVLEITGECDPCSRMDEVVAGLSWVLTSQWRGGVTCRVLIGGNIAIGDAVRIERPVVGRARA